MFCDTFRFGDLWKLCKEDFYFLTMDQYNGQKWNFTIDTNRLDGQNPTKFIKEKNGLLINKSLLKDNTLPLVATINSSERPKNLKLKFCTTTEDFYRYNFYQESSNGVINQSSNLHFNYNLNYKTVIGSFSGMSTKIILLPFHITHFLFFLNFFYPTIGCEPSFGVLIIYEMFEWPHTQNSK